MSVIEILLIAVGVSVDAFAVSVAGALSAGEARRIRNGINAALFFGAFQVIMPLIGYFAANLTREWVAAFDHYLAFGLLLFVGGKMIYEAFHEEPESGAITEKFDFFAPKNLFLPAVATSIDAAAVGASIAFSGAEIWAPSSAMGISTALFSFVGVWLGGRLGALAGRRVNFVLPVIGGLILIGIGIKMLVTL